MSTILLVEDNAADVNLLRMALQDASLDCDLVVFADGAEIINHIRKSDSAFPPSVPDLVILDLNLPKSNGLEVLAVIRDCQAFANVPVAVLSSSSSARERAQLAAFHICEFIVKPPDLDAYMNIGRIVRGLLNEPTAL
jgi:DNA-binding response OmpR family regulator